MPECFDLVTLADGVFAAVSEITGPAVGNAAIIDTGERTLVVDSFQSPTAAAELHREAVRLTGRSAHLLVNTHWHSDHTWGNQEFAGIPIVSTARTVELIVADRPADLTEYTAELDAQLASLREQRQSDDATVRAAAEQRWRTLSTWRDDAADLRITLPDLLIDDRLVVAGSRRVEILTFGGGHTDSDVFVSLPDDRILVTGDLCWNRIHPRTQDGHPRAWAEILDRIRALGATRIHPGHGEPGGADIPESMVPYLRTVARYVDEVRAGAPATALVAPEGSADWAGVERMRKGVAVLADRAASH